jgi:hypothetical protein
MENKIKILLAALTKKSLNNETVWSKTSGDNEFKIILSKATLTIDKWLDEDGENYDVKIYNEDGEEIESIHSMESEDFDNENFKLLQGLHDAVSKTFYKIDETIDSILDELENKKIIGKN